MLCVISVKNHSVVLGSGRFVQQKFDCGGSSSAPIIRFRMSKSPLLEASVSYIEVLGKGAR